MENFIRNRGRPQNYTFDRGGVPAEMGPYIGIVVNNVDNTRSGRLQVYIEEFGAVTPDGKPNLTDPTLWRTVSYCPPFYGVTPQITGTSQGAGTYPGNRNSYGMWFTPPDLGVRVICFFINGDPSQGYYLGCIPEQGMTHMIPAIGASDNYTDADNQLDGSPQLPVVEINDLNGEIAADPQFWKKPKPVQRVIAGEFLQQGLNKDTVRGPIRSNSQRESPSASYGISTPGRAIFNGPRNDPKTIGDELNQGNLTLEDVAVIGRMGGHSIVLDDGDLAGRDQLMRFRTSRGHQITLSDDGECIYIVHANGQSWVEMNREGAIDVYSSNSLNLRTQGTLNLHADRDINMYSGGRINIKSRNTMQIESERALSMSSQNSMILYSKKFLGLGSDARLALQANQGTWKTSGVLSFSSSTLHLQGGPTIPVTAPPAIREYRLDDTVYSPGEGWVVRPNKLPTIVTRAPTHEPYPYHNSGVDNQTELDEGGSAPQSTTSLGLVAEQKLAMVSDLPVTDGIEISDYAAEPAATVSIGDQINNE